MAPDMVDWGRDHWSTFGYLAITISNGKQIHPRHLRLDGETYPTRLTEGRTLPGHSDRDCLDDFVTHGLAVKEGKYSFRLTDRGWEIAKRLFQWKSQKKSFGLFSLDPNNLK